MRRRRLLVVSGLLAASFVAAPALDGFAQDRDKGGKRDKDKGGGKDKDGDKEKDPKDTPEWRACARVASDLQSRDTERLTARMKPDGKLSIGLGQAAREYAAKQAGPVIAEWLKDKTELSVEVVRMHELVGELKVTYYPEKSNKRAACRVSVTLERKSAKEDVFYLTRIETL